MPTPSLEGLKARDPQAQSALWRTHRPKLHRLCLTIVSDDAEATDITDGVLVDFLFGHVDGVQNPRAVGAYLKLMVVRRARRRQKRTHLGTEGTDDLVHPQLGAEHSAEQVLLLRRLTECADRLTPKARTVLRLRYRAELTNERIGALVGGSKQYIGRLIKKSEAALRTCLADQRQARLERQGEWA